MAWMSIVVVGAEVAVEGAEVVAESGMASVVVVVVVAVTVRYYVTWSSPGSAA